MNAYLHGLIIILAFPVVYKILRKRGYLKDVDYNWMVFTWVLVIASILIITGLFVSQGFEKIETQRICNKKVRIAQRKTEAHKEIIIYLMRKLRDKEYERRKSNIRHR